MNIAVITGGLSTERDVAISSGTKIKNALREKGHNVVFIDVFMGYEKECNPKELFESNADLVSFDGVTENVPDLEAVKAMREDKSDCFLGKNVVEICRFADITFFALHGGEGENGKLQAAFDILGIKYTGADYLSAALAMDKGITKALFDKHKVLNPKGEIFKADEDIYSWDVFPCVIKPCSGGSSVGIARADNREQFKAAVEDAFRYEDEIVIEQFVTGREFSVGILGDKVLPPIEIIPTTGFYDYKAKYQAGLTIEECPAKITESEDETLRKCAMDAYRALCLESYARMDFILDDKGDAYCLEANTLPGMTPTSLLPQEAAAVGIDYATLCEKIVELSLEKYR
ncbi:MAG: D-alanine--D-alanine ligase [Ruminococcus sp.]|nr:D-alanine--D-alanine ligase [Ruminococcus sp.]